MGALQNGARRPKSLLMAGTQYLCFGEYMIFKGANSYHINSCDTIEIFYPIRIDLDKLKYAAHITKIINDVTDENQNTYKILQLVLNTLYVISETDKNLSLVLSIFKLRLLCFLGFTPRIRECTNCKRNDKISYFSLESNGYKCVECGKVDKSCIQINEATVNAIKYIVMAPDKKIFSFNVSEESQKELELITKLYMNDKLEKEYKLEELF